MLNIGQSYSRDVSKGMCSQASWVRHADKVVFADAVFCVIHCLHDKAGLLHPAEERRVRNDISHSNRFATIHKALEVVQLCVNPLYHIVSINYT